VSHDDRPIATTSFPWMRTGLALGTSFAALFAALANDEPPPPVAVVDVDVAPIVVIDPPPAVSAKPYAPVDVPWPPGERRSSGSSRGNGRQIEVGDSPLSVPAADRFFEEALASCAPSRLIVGKSIALFCESASEESRALIVARDPPEPGDSSGLFDTWLRTSRMKYSAPGAAVNEVGMHSCGATMRFVALPPGARVSSHGGSNDSGHCTFDVDGLPAVTWSTMLHNMFRPGTAVHKRQLDDGVITRWTAEAWDGGWWRVDVVSASANAQAPANEQRARVELARWTPGEQPWTPPMRLADKIAALETCWEPCSLALRSPARELGPDMRAQMKAGDVIDRCLYECRGTEQAPAVLEPAARAFGPPRHVPGETAQQREVRELASEDSIR
jgi:hypothetical protein